MGSRGGHRTCCSTGEVSAEQTVLKDRMRGLLVDRRRFRDKEIGVDHRFLNLLAKGTQAEADRAREVQRASEFGAARRTERHLHEDEN